MKIAAGVDLIEVRRIETALSRFGRRFLERVYTSRELEDARGRAPSLAARFAAKEAVSKALGTGIGRIAWQEIEVLNGAEGQPVLRLHGAAAERASQLGLNEWAVSLSHTQEQAVAVVFASA
jgi:holo-[acyl-carrier protein] synthase